MNFFAKMKAVAIALGFVDKAKNQEMTATDWSAFSAAYKKEYGTDFAVDQAEHQRLLDEAANNPSAEQNEVAAQTTADNAAALAILNSALAENGGATPAVQDTTPQADTATPTSSTVSVVDAATAIATAMREMAVQTTPDAPMVVTGTIVSANGPGHTDTHFCGIDHPIFSMDERYNQIAVNPSLAITKPLNANTEKTVGSAFRAQLSEYAAGVSARINTLREANMLNSDLLSAGINIGIASDGLGDQYLIRRTDLLIARLAAIKNVYDIFPRLFGVQDREVMINAFLGDFSQAYQKGPIWKGNIELAPETCYVDDVMFKTLFNSMKEIERQYIGYLNSEGSDPIKWTMIEWAMLNISTKLIEEQSKRKMLGVYVKPETGKPGHTLNAGTGVYYTLLRYYNEAKIKLIDESAFASYTSGATMVACVTNMLQHLALSVADLDGYEVILNASHRAMWIAGIRDIYGKDTDFSGPKGDAVPDHLNSIRWCPYLGQLPLILIQQPGNIQSIEFEAGEMHAVQFDSDMEDVKAWSTWKEGTSAAYAGKKFSTKAERKAHGYDDQMIFMNRPSVTVAIDADMLTVSGDIRHYVTGVNTAAKAITDITGAKAGAAYLIEVGDETHPQTIAKSGKFADITAAYTPTKVGDYILVILNTEGDKFRELERCVDGTRTINTLLQPNTPGGR